jgi:8-oxo-dGTP pyrophosphatase MutT (NUDIX family)
MNQQPNKINVRVYGILIDGHKRVLVSDEYIRGDYFTKFPGGGLELGEGTRDCLKREFKEETGLDVVVGEHLYTTDFYQQSAFNKEHQILSIYYYVHCNDLKNLPVHTVPFDFTPEQTSDPAGQSEALRWIDWDTLNDLTVSLPIDKVVVQLLKKRQDNYL